MATIKEIQDLAKLGADSVFGYIERTAEKVDDVIRWQTLSYQNEPDYNPSIFNGVAGICLFLADYFRLTGMGRAKELALGGVRWSSLPEYDKSIPALYFGWTGVAMAWLHLSKVTGDAKLIEPCEAHARGLL